MSYKSVLSTLGVSIDLGTYISIFTINNHNMLRHIINMNGGFGHTFERKVSRLPYSVIQQIDRKVYLNVRLFTQSKQNRVGLHNLRVKAML